MVAISYIRHNSGTDEALIQQIKEAGQAIRSKYCRRTPSMPTMLPPIPNCSKYIDQFPEEGLNSQNEDDKRRQEDYAAEVTVYRALEDLEENIVVLHSLDYTNRQFRLFKSDFSFDESKPNKITGECDFVAVGENCVVIIEVSDVRKDEGKTTDRKLKKAFNAKKKQGERTKELIEGVLRHVNPADGKTGPYITWYCAYLSLSSDSEKIFTETQRSNIIFADSFSSIQQWWNENVVVKARDVSFSEKRMNDVEEMLLGLWSINPQNKICIEEKCSFGRNIMEVDSQLKNSHITYGFRRLDDLRYNNPHFVQAGDIVKSMGIECLSKEQESVFQSTEKFLWINGPAGSGKTILILGKAIKTAQSESGKIVIFKNMSEDRSKKMYQQTLENSGTNFGTVDTDIDTSKLYAIDVDAIAEDFARKTCEVLDKCSVALLEFGNTESCPVYHVSNNCGGLQIINKIISHILKLRRQRSQERLMCFIDDEHCLLEDKYYDRVKRIEEFKKTIISEESIKCSIWIFTDIAQSPNHMAPENLPSLFPEMDAMLQTYNHLSLSRNFRNTFEIGNLLASIRENIMISPEQLSGHFIRGPRPALYYIDVIEQQYKLKKVEEIIRSEIDKVIDSEFVKLSDVGFIINSEQSRSFLSKTLEEKVTTLLPVCNIADSYSAEWPAILFLMDLTDLDDQDYKLSHQFYLALSRARVYCSAVIYSLSSEGMNTNILSMLQKLEQYATISRYVEEEVRPFPSTSAITESGKSIQTRGGLLPSEVHSRTKSTTPGVLRYKHLETPQTLLALPQIGEQDNLPLHCAARDGKLDEVKHLIKAGETVNRRNEEGYTALHYAVQYGNLELVRYLVKSRADVNYSDNKDLTPLHYAVQQGNLDLVRYLVKSRADVNYSDNKDLTPLHYAVQQGNLELVRYLVKSRADVNYSDNKDLTPLHYAVQQEKLELVRYLVESGADVNYRDRKGLTPLYYAVQQGNLELVRYLVESGADVNYSDRKRLTPLYYAVQQGKLELVRYLVESGAYVNYRNNGGFTVLQQAIHQQSVEIMQYLNEKREHSTIQKNPSKVAERRQSKSIMRSREKFRQKRLVLPEIEEQDNLPLHSAARDGKLDEVKNLIKAGEIVNRINKEGHTALHYAVQQGNLELVRYLVKSKAYVNYRDKEDLTPLHYAVQQGNLELVRYLVKSKAYVNYRDKEDLTPLHYAVQQENLELVRYLVKSKADVNYRDKEDLTPLHFAAQQGNLELVRYLVKSKAYVNCSDKEDLTPLHYAAQQGNLELVRYLVKSKAYVNCSDKEDLTPLHYAAQQGNLELVRYLVESGASVNCRDKEGLTPLHFAAQQGNLELVRYLVKSKAYVNCSDKEDLTPLHYAAQQGNLELVRYLVKSGADVNYSDRKGLTPLYYAVQQGNLELVRYLVESKAYVNCSDNGGLSTLHYALVSQHENLGVVKFLVESGASVNTRSIKGYTPLHYASILRNARVDVVRYLVESGANVNALDAYGKTAVQHAAEMENNEIMRYLEERVEVKSG